MAVKLPDGKIARTQPEQVKKNMDDIESIKSELDIIKEGIASAYKIQGSEDVADLNALEKAEEMNGYVYNMLDAGNLVNEDASTLAVQIGDNVVFVWNGGDWYWDRLAGLVDTSNLCTLDTTQEISGEKTFTNAAGIIVKGTSNASSKWSIKGQDYLLYFDDSANRHRFYSSWDELVINEIIKPFSNNTFDIGTSSYTWKDIYLSGKIDFGNGSYINKDQYDRITFSVDNNAKIVIAAGQTYINNNFLPLTNNSRDLGSNDYKWRDIYLVGSLKDGTNSISVAQLHKIIKHQITANGKTVQVFSYYDGSYSGETIASIFGSVAGSTAWGMKATSELNNPDLIVVSDGGLAYFTGTGTFTKYLNPTDTITADSYSVWE